MKELNRALTTQEKLSGVSRRDFLKIAGTFGLMSTVLAATAATGVLTSATLAQAANSTYDKRFAKQPRVTLKFGGSDYNPERCLLLRSGWLDFVRDLEERTDGEIRIEWFGDSTICTQADCMTKAQQGIVDFYGATTQNLAQQGPYFNAIDFAYMFPNSAAIYYFLYHPKSEALWREPLRRMHNSLFLFSQAELRGIGLGEKYRKSELIKNMDQLKGAKIRTAGSQLCVIALQALGVNPVPIAWAETPDALRQGLVDGFETTPQSISLGLSPMVSQYLDIRFYPCTAAACMNYKKFKTLPAELQNAIMESAYFTQAFVQGTSEATIVNTAGFGEHSPSTSLFGKDGVRSVLFTDAYREELAKKCSPKYNPAIWEKWRERINKWANGQDVFQGIYDIAHEIPANMPAENVEPRRWWKG